MDQIILFGDSLTQQSSSQARGFGFKPALEDAYIRRLDIVNRGFSGYNTVQALKVLPKIIPSPQQARVRLITIFFGANDARLPDTPGYPQSVALEEYTKNIISLATHPAITAHRPRIILITPPPVEERLLGASNDNGVITRTADNSARYAEAVRQVGKKVDVLVLDLWSAFMKHVGWKEGEPLPGSRSIPQNEILAGLLHDGLHFNPEGYKILYKEFMQLVARSIPDLMPEELPFVLPAWDDADAWAE